jgi:hypothetical protein
VYIHNPYKSSVIVFKLALRPFNVQLSRLEARVTQLEAEQQCTLVAYSALVGTKLPRETSELCDRIQGALWELNVRLDQSWSALLFLGTVVEAKDFFNLL